MAEMRVKVLHRYMAGAFLRPFFYSLVLFALLVFLGSLFDRLTNLLRSEAGFTTILSYLLLQVPYWTVRIVPVATLLATMLCVSELVKSGEWIAILASGYRPAQVIAPLAVCAGLVGVGAFVAQETVMPYAFARSKEIYEYDISKRPRKNHWKDVVLVSKPRQFLMARVFEPSAGRMSRVVMDTFGDQRTQIDALEARWEDGRWVFFNGVRRVYGNGALVSGEEAPFDRLPSDMRVPPEDLVPRTREPDEMSLAETVRHLSLLKRLGAQSRRAEVALQFKIAYPFSNLVIFALGVPFGLRMRRANKALCFAQALAIGFIFWWILSLGQKLAEAGRVPAWAGAWAVNVAFGALGGWGLWKSGL